MPSISISETIPSQLCEKFAKCFSPGVIEIDEDASGTKTVRVANPRKDTLSREVYRHPEFRDGVELGRIRDHYICKEKIPWSGMPENRGKANSPSYLLVTIQSCGQYLASDLIPASLQVVLSKLKVLRSAFDTV